MGVTAWISSVLIVAMMFFTIYDIILRDVLGRQSRWVSDFVTFYLLIYVTLLPAGWILQKGDHVTVDIVPTLISAKHRQRLSFVTNILGLIYSGLLTWQGWLFTWREFTHGSSFPIAAWLPVWPAVVIIFVGGVFLCLAFIMKIVRGEPSHRDQTDFSDRID